MVRMAFYRDPEKRAEPVEQYTDPDDSDGQPHNIYNKAIYFEHVTLRNTNADYAVELTSSGLLPQIIPLLPIEKISGTYPKTANGKAYKLVMHPKHREEYSTTPSLKMMYIFRNGFSAGNSYFGKNIKYKTERFSAILDFTQISNFEQLITDSHKHAYGEPMRRALRRCRLRGPMALPLSTYPDWMLGTVFVFFWNWSDSLPRQESRVPCDSMR